MTSTKQSKQERQKEWRRKQRENPEFRLKAAEIQRRYYANNPDYKAKALVYRLRTRYGVTPEQYQELFDKQEGKCAVCKRHQSELKNRLVLDHDHKTLEIRALLCAYCNLRVVGKLRKDTIQAVYDYLTGEYTGWFTPKRKRKKRHGKKLRRRPQTNI